MSQAIFIQNVAHLRAQPSLHSELVSQAIMGDSAKILEVRKDWSFVRTEDSYEAWTRSDWLSKESAEFEATHRISSPIADYSLSSVRGVADKLVFGTPVQLENEEQGRMEKVRLVSGEVGWVQRIALKSVVDLGGFREDGSAAWQTARRFLGTPYLWGGGTAFGFDCSGFVQRLYAFFNVRLPRNANQQAVSPLGTTLSADEPWQAGDLVFFLSESDPLGRGITHVGMALDADRFIHASSKLGVAITPKADPYYSRWYHSAWRLNS